MVYQLYRCVDSVELTSILPLVLRLNISQSYLAPIVPNKKNQASHEKFNTLSGLKLYEKMY